MEDIFDELDEDSQLEKARKAKADRELELYTIRNTMGTPHGRRMFYRMIFPTGVYNGTFSPDPYVNAYNSGLRAQGFSIIAELTEASHELYLTMLKENQ